MPASNIFNTGQIGLEGFFAMKMTVRCESISICEKLFRVSFAGYYSYVDSTNDVKEYCECEQFTLMAKEYTLSIE